MGRNVTDLISLFEQIDVEPWQRFSQPEWNKPHSVSKALHAVCNAKNGAASSDAGDLLLYAVGNNHAGTYFPVLLGTLPFLEQILCCNEPWPVRIVLCVLDDLVASFQPEPGYEIAEGVDGEKIDVAKHFKASMLKLCPQLTLLVNMDQFNASVAQQLLDLINEVAN